MRVEFHGAPWARSRWLWMAVVLGACASPEERCNAARVEANDRLVAYADALRAAPAADIAGVSAAAYAQIDATCRAAVGIEAGPTAAMSASQAQGLISCRGNALLDAAGAWPAEAAVRRLVPMTRGSTIEFRDGLAGFRESDGGRLANGPDATAALAAADALVELCILVDP